MTAFRWDTSDFERANATQVARATIADYCDANDMSIQLIEIDDLLEVSHCTIQDGEHIEFGSGKGPGHSVGALAEAVEHGLLRKPLDCKIKMLPIEEVANQQAFARDFYTQFLAQHAQGELVSAVNFKCLKSGAIVNVPAGLIAPDHFASESGEHSEIDLKLRKYCSNNGCALGLNRDEALLHALNEVIERHYESLLYLQLLGHESDADWFVFDDIGESLFGGKRALVESRFGPTTTLVTSTSFGSFVALSLLDSRRAGFSTQIGAGSSLYLHCALQRSMNELAQSLALSSADAPGFDEFQNEELVLLERARAHKGLDRIILLSAEDLRAQFVSIDCQNSKTIQPRISVARQVEVLLERLGREHFVLMRRFDAGTSLFACQILVPSFERAFMLKRGHFVASNAYYESKVAPQIATIST